MSSFRASGAMTLQQIADGLNECLEPVVPTGLRFTTRGRTPERMDGEPDSLPHISGVILFYNSKLGLRCRLLCCPPYTHVTMRRLLRLSGIAVLTLFSLDFIIWLLDYLARWDFIKAILERYPKLGWFVHTPYVYVVLLAVCFATLYLQHKARQPYILARYMNARLCPDLHSLTVPALFDTEQKKPGWDTKHEFDWNWFVELRLVNDSDTPTTVHEVEVEVKAGGDWFRRLIGQTRELETSLMDNVTDFRFTIAKATHMTRKRRYRYRALWTGFETSPSNEALAMTAGLASTSNKRTRGK